MKRVASAVGEGAGALQNVHQYVNEVEVEHALSDKEQRSLVAASSGT